MVVIKTLKVIKFSDRFGKLPPHLVAPAVVKYLSKDANVDLVRSIPDGKGGIILYLEFFTRETAVKVKDKFDRMDLVLKFDWSFTNLRLCLNYPPKTVRVSYVRAKRDSWVPPGPEAYQEFNPLMPWDDTDGLSGGNQTQIVDDEGDVRMDT